MTGFGVYHSKEESPDLPHCLERARRDIQSQYKIRAKLLNTDLSFLETWKRVRHLVFQERMVASEWDKDTNMLRLTGELPEVHALTRVAIAFWLEAKVAFNDHLHRRSWAALVRCNYYIGMCCAHETKKERSARGGRHTARRLAPLRTMVLESLAGMETDSYATKQDVWEVLLPRMRAFKTPPPSAEQILEQQRRVARGPEEIYEGTFDRVHSNEKSSNSKSTNPKKLIQVWTREDAEIRSEIERISRASFNTRAKRSKKNAQDEKVATVMESADLIPA
nr:hypothetical protein [Stenotrophomonas geniculata]